MCMRHHPRSWNTGELRKQAGRCWGQALGGQSRGENHLNNPWRNAGWRHSTSGALRWVHGWLDPSVTVGVVVCWTQVHETSVMVAAEIQRLIHQLEYKIEENRYKTQGPQNDINQPYTGNTTRIQQGTN